MSCSSVGSPPSWSSPLLTSRWCLSMVQVTVGTYAYRIRSFLPSNGVIDLSSGWQPFRLCKNIAKLLQELFLFQAWPWVPHEFVSRICWGWLLLTGFTDSLCRCTDGISSVQSNILFIMVVILICFELWLFPFNSHNSFPCWNFIKRLLNPQNIVESW